MTDIEHAKKYAEESISLAISMYNPKAEIIAETACLYGLTYKNEQLTKAKEIIGAFITLDYIQLSPSDRIVDLRDKAEQFIKEIEK